MGKTVDQIKEEIQEDVDELLKKFDKYKKDGFKLIEIVKFSFDAGVILVEAVENVQGITGKQKKEVVVSTVQEVYKKVNPDIPLIPEPFETWMENPLLDRVLDIFIDFIIKKYKEKKIIE